MPVYDYQALDAQGRATKGQLDAASERAARQNLRERGMTPIALQAGEGAGRGGASAGGAPRWPRAQRVLFTRQLAAMLSAGMPLESALGALMEQTDDERTRRLLRRLRADVAAGMPLSGAMEAQAPAFDTMYCALVRVAEKTGRLDRILDELAGHMEAGDAFRQRITVAMVYPAAILFVALLVVGALLLYVVPQIVEVFARQKQALPILTRILIGSSDLLRAVWLPAGMLLLASVWPAVRLWRRPAVRARTLRMAGHWPVLGRLLRVAGTYRFAATLGMALKGGVPLVAALALTRAALRMPDQQQTVDGLIEAVSRGASLGASLQGVRGKAFEPGLRHYVALGEQNGRLADMLGEVARQQRAALEYRIGWLTGLLEPALVLAMGGLVLLIVLAILMPIIEINQFLR